MPVNRIRIDKKKCLVNLPCTNNSSVELPRLKKLNSNISQYRNLVLLSLNCQSMKNKVQNVMTYLEDNHVDISFLQETWLTSGDKNILAEIKEYGYKIQNQTRDTRRGGGLSILYKSNIQLTRLPAKPEMKFHTFETICSNFSINKIAITLVNLYRPPYSVKNQHTIKQFLEEFDVFLSFLYELKGFLLLFGDFNINVMDKQNKYPQEFTNLLETYNLTQLIKQSTHVKGGAIDLIIVDKKLEEYVISPLVCNDFQTDHFPLKMEIKAENKKSKVVKKKYIDYENCDLEHFALEIKNSPLTNYNFYTSLSMTECIQLYNSTISESVRKNCPVNTKTYRADRAKSSWYNSALQVLKQDKRKAERRFKKNSTEENKENMKRIRNKYNRELKLRRMEFYNEKIKGSIRKPKQLFKTLGKLTGNVQENTLPTFDTSVTVANQMAQFYTDKITTIRKNLCSGHKTCYKKQSNESTVIFDKFSIIDMDELKQVIALMNSKTCKLDPAPTSIIMKIELLLYPIILHIVNTMLETGVFPDDLKHALVTPIIKDLNKNCNELKNYRPISNLSFLSKILEKIICLQLEHYIEENNLHAKFQSAYRRHNSCETALVKVMGDISEHLLEKRYVALVLLDSSAAFDTVDHSILLDKLENNFGIKHTALHLIKSYLENRTFSVIIEDIESSPQSLGYGVPQGSLLGPLLYILYTKEIEGIVAQNGLQIHMYADDCQLYMSFKGEDYMYAQEKINKCLVDIKKWMDNNCLKLNMEKTTLKLFSPNINSISSFKLNYNGVMIQPSDIANILGVRLGTDLKFSSFIAKKVQVCNFHLRNIYNIKDSLPHEARVILVTNLIISNLDYCNAILICSNLKAIKPLELILNRAVRFICNVRKRDHITPYLKKLHILPIKFRIRFKACLLGFKLFNQISPNYLVENFPLYKPSTNINLRLGPGRDFFMFDTEKSEKNAICQGIKKEWNKLPINIRCLNSLTYF